MIKAIVCWFFGHKWIQGATVKVLDLRGQPFSNSQWATRKTYHCEKCDSSRVDYAD